MRLADRVASWVNTPHPRNGLLAGAVRIVDERGIGSLGDLRPLLKLEPELDIQDPKISPDGRLLAYVVNDP